MKGRTVCPVYLHLHLQPAQCPHAVPSIHGTELRPTLSGSKGHATLDFSPSNRYLFTLIHCVLSIVLWCPKENNYEI